MKKILKLFFTMILSISLLFTFPATVFAYEYAEPNIVSMINTQKVGAAEVKSIDRHSINKIKCSKSKQFKNKNEQQKVNEVLSALNVDLT